MRITIAVNMIIYDKITDEKDMYHNDKWPLIPDHQYKVLIFEGSETVKSNSLPNLIYEWRGIKKIYLYVKDLEERKHEYIKKTKRSCNTAFQCPKCIYLAFK